LIIYGRRDEVRKMMLTIGSIAVLLAIIVIGGKVIRYITTPTYSLNHGETNKNGVEMSRGNTMIAKVESQEEAEEIANLYGIELLQYRNKIATFSTEKDPLELMQWGEEQGYPTLGINQEYSIN